MSEKTKSIRVPEFLHAEIKFEAFKRRHKLEFFTAELLRAGIKAYKRGFSDRGAK